MLSNEGMQKEGREGRSRECESVAKGERKGFRMRGKLEGQSLFFSPSSDLAELTHDRREQRWEEHASEL